MELVYSLYEEKKLLCFIFCYRNDLYDKCLYHKCLIKLFIQTEPHTNGGWLS